MINDILDMSKIESGKMKLEPVNFNMREMLDTIGELIAPQAAAKRIEFVQDVRLAHDWFRADRMRISQVLINLLGNAAKFTPAEGRITLRVQETEQAKGESKLYFAVSDTGVGIAKEDQDRVFRSFEQAGGANPAKQQGTGLGLSISSRLVQMMGSSIQLDSTLGVGSTFSFSILLGLGENVDAVTISVLMILVPGVALTNAMREIMAGDTISGLSRTAEAILIAAAIALGSAVGLSISRML